MTPQIYYAMLKTFSTIIKLLNFEWREHTMRDGRRGYILFFSDEAWMVDKLTKEILPRVDPAE
jgi:hypothetical protein